MEIKRFRLPTGRDLTIARVLGVVMLGVLAVIWLTRPPLPPISTMNGTYLSTCCKPIRLENGILTADEQRVPFELRRMKYGLVLYPERAVEVHNGLVVIADSTNDVHGIIFDENSGTLTLVEANPADRTTDFVFKRR